MCTYFNPSAFYSPTQLVRGSPPSDLLDKPWTQMCSLLVLILSPPPANVLVFLSRIGFIHSALPFFQLLYARLFSPWDFAKSRSRGFRYH